MAGGARYELFWRGKERFVKAGKARRGRSVLAGYGMAGKVGGARLGVSRLGEVFHGRHGIA